MKRASRLLLLAAAAGAALVISGSASTAPTGLRSAKLNITTQPGSGATGPVTIEVSQAGTDDPLAHITIYTGLGYTASLTATSGTQIGVATAKVQSADLGNATVPVAGTVQARDASGTYVSGGTQVPLATAATACTGTAAHAAFWVAAYQAAGQALELPLFVDPAAGPETAFAAYKIQACFPDPTLPAGDPRRAPLGLKLIDAVLTLKSVFTNPTSAGTPVWSAFFTPYTPGTGVANPAGTVESRSATIVPAAISLVAKYIKALHAAVLAGIISAGGRPLSGIAVPIYSGP
ncbi:MAG: hypothetical protein C5B48_15510, partial [Candidatus Rokuibacteriota bacterium]